MADFKIGQKIRFTCYLRSGDEILYDYPERYVGKSGEIVGIECDNRNFYEDVFMVQMFDGEILALKNNEIEIEYEK